MENGYNASITGDLFQPVYRIHSVELTETKKYQPLTVRPYETNVTHNELCNIEDMVVAVVNKGLDISSNESGNNVFTELASRGSNILLPSSSIVKEANIANSWSTERFAFKLLLEISIPGTASSTYNLVQGYSEFLDISYKGNPDTNMALYINSIIILRKVNNQLALIGNYTTMLDETGEMMKEVMSQRMKVTRPEDIVTRISAMSDTDSDAEYIDNLGNVNEVQVVSNEIINPIGHVSGVISNTISDTKINGTFSSDTDILNSVTGSLSAGSNPLAIDFLKILYNKYNEVTTMFTLNDLTSIDPHMSAPTVNLSDGNDLNFGIMPYDASDTFNASIETRMCELVRVTIRDVLNFSTLSSISFVIENSLGTPNYSLTAAPTSIIPFIDVVTQGEIFLDVFIKKIWNVISNANKSLVQLRVFVLGTDTTIFISMDGRPEVPYVLPTFADGKAMPILMDDYSQDVITEGYKEILETTIGTTKSILKNRSNRILNQFGM